MAGNYNVLCLITIAVAFNSVTATNYCNMKSCLDKIHTMCWYTSSEPGAVCGKKLKNIGLTADEKKDIVEKHNQLRRKVASGQETRGNPGPQPAAVSMPDLTWDDELATIAQRWANQCYLNHDECRNVGEFEVGQNMAANYIPTESNFSLINMVQSWYDEVAIFNRNGVEKYVSDPDTQSYTQVIWAKTNKIGCGRTTYELITDLNNHHLFCNYGPAGNHIGEPIYEVK